MKGPMHFSIAIIASLSFFTHWLPAIITGRVKKDNVPQIRLTYIWVSSFVGSNKEC